MSTAANSTSIEYKFLYVQVDTYIYIFKVKQKQFVQEWSEADTFKLHDQCKLPFSSRSHTEESQNNST